MIALVTCDSSQQCHSLVKQDPQSSLHNVIVLWSVRGCSLSLYLTLAQKGLELAVELSFPVPAHDANLEALRSNVIVNFPLQPLRGIAILLFFLRKRINLYPK